MAKIPDDILIQCNANTCCDNEIVILPEKGDVGFDEYFDRKVDMVIEAKHLFTPIEQNKLLLAYPMPPTKNDNNESLFPLFFESAGAVARHRVFEGCFGIDVTAYLGKTDSSRFRDLLAYIGANEDAVYSLLIYTDNAVQAKKFCNEMEEYGDFREVQFGYPDANQLTKYTCELIRSYSMPVDKSGEESIRMYYSNKSCGYDTAEHIAKVVRSSDYDGSAESLDRVIDEIERKGRKEFGY